jgi:hypothetical protein
VAGRSSSILLRRCGQVGHLRPEPAQLGVQRRDLGGLRLHHLPQICARGMQPRIGLAQPGQLSGRIGHKPHYTTAGPP